MSKAIKGRDFRAELAGIDLWDAACEAQLAERGEALVDRPLQSREELIDLCRLIERCGIRSYLEIGVWTGALVRLLHDLFDFELVAACDQGYAERFGLEVRLPPGARFFRGSSESAGYAEFRAELGSVDLVMIDADHSYRAVRADFERERRFQQRFVALHDITGARRQTAGVGRLWREISGGHKLEIVRPAAELGLDHSLMGIGIWSSFDNGKRED
ncbi:MAG: class I SAM-dependent methyltransferase [Polyangia bacterium]